MNSETGEVNRTGIDGDVRVTKATSESCRAYLPPRLVEVGEVVEVKGIKFRVHEVCRFLKEQRIVLKSARQ